MDKHQRKVDFESHKKNQPTSGKNAVQGQLKASDKYFVPKDYIWKDAVIHEKRLKKSWDRDWGNLIASQQHKINLLADDLRRKRQFTKNFCLKSDTTVDGSFVNDPERKDLSRVLPEKIPGVDLQSQKKLNLNNLYRTVGPVPKIRFVPEQYGYYRTLQYLHGGSKIIEEPQVEILSEIKHTVNPLLC